MDTQALLLQAIQAAPGDELAWRALADFLEEQGELDRAELLRLTLSLTPAPGGEDRPARERRVQELLAAGTQPMMPVLNVLGIEMVLVPPGSFVMGSPAGEPRRYENEGPQHKVTLTRGFYLGRFPVTRAQWRALMDNAPASWRKANRPAEEVSWRDAQELCARLTKKVGRRFRLPTEAEWEYACRAGTTTVYCSGDDVTALEKVGWCSYDGTYPGTKQARRVGSFLPNAFGLYDMHGNVWEWCEDGFGPYSADDVTDPCLAVTEGARVVRGGSWRFPPNYARSAYRGGVAPAERRSSWGCRIALGAGEGD
jgi:uncharacterized protein (TIGR02996 family)